MSDLHALLERFRRGPEVVAAATTGAAGPVLDYRPAPEKWSIRQILWHLADSEIAGAMRFRQVIAEDEPTLQAYDQDAWARNLGYERRKFSPALELFRRLRLENHALLSSLPPEAFSRTGRHTETGVVTLLDLLRLYTEHAESHARRILELRRAYKAPR